MEDIAIFRPSRVSILFWTVIAVTGWVLTVLSIMGGLGSLLPDGSSAFDKVAGVFWWLVMAACSARLGYTGQSWARTVSKTWIKVDSLGVHIRLPVYNGGLRRPGTEWKIVWEDVVKVTRTRKRTRRSVDRYTIHGRQCTFSFTKLQIPHPERAALLVASRRGLAVEELAAAAPAGRSVAGA